MLRRQSIGQEGASAEFCDLSGRGLTTAQVERSLRVFDTAVAIDMSNNELEQIPTTIPTELVALDISFNLLAHAHGLERLQFLQELHLGFNRLADVSILEFCPLLQRVNLSGNRLATTRGLESLARLEHLDLSDNLIEYPEALRALSMNQHLTHLTIRGNPIAHRATIDCRVLVLDMMPSVLILDDRKIRAAAKCKQLDDPSSSSSSGATKSLSYSRIYDDKKQFVVRTQQMRKTPATRPSPILLGDPTIPLKYEGSTIFLHSPKATTITQDVSVPYPAGNQSRSPRRMATTIGPPPAPTSAAPMRVGGTVRVASPTASGGAYVSLYDRLAAAHGISANKPPPEELPVVELQRQQPSHARRPGSSQSRRNDAKTGNAPEPSHAPISSRRSIDAGSARPPSRGGPQSVPHTLTPSTSQASAVQIATYPQSSHQKPTHAARTAQPQTSQTSTPSSSAYVHSSSASPTPAHHSVSAALQAPSHSLDPKQQNVLSVIQNLIQHKKQTLATLARQSSSATATSVYSS